jgi:uncharacterized membrane protein
MVDEVKLTIRAGCHSELPLRIPKSKQSNILRVLEKVTRNRYRLLLVSIIGSAYSALSILRHRHFSSSAFGIFDQVIWLYSRFEAPYSTIRANRLDENILGDHFHPILILLAPLYWLTNTVEALLVAQAFLFTIAIFPIFFFTRKRLGTPAAYMFSISYALFWGVQRAVEFDFHEIALAVPLIAWSIYFIDDKRWRAYYFCIALLLLTKEDLSLLVIFLGFYLVTVKEFKRGLLTSLAGALWFVAVMRLFIPYFAGDGNYHYWTYIQFGPNFLAAVRTIVKNPLLAARELFLPAEKLHTYFLVFAPFLCLSFLSPLFILLIPLLVERFLSAQPLYWTTGFHYTAAISPIVAMASADGLSKIVRLINNKRLHTAVIIASSAVVLTVNTIMLPKLPLWQLMNPNYWRLNQSDLTGREALLLIPSTASVAAQGTVLPHLSHRKYIYFMPYNLVSLPDADYIIACKHLGLHPYPSAVELEGYLASQQAKGYRKIFDKEDWIVLSK